MSIIRTTAMICLTLLICVGLFIYYGSIENRYKLIKADAGLYIFDKNSSVTNYCNTIACRGLSSGLIVPHRNEFWGIPGVPQPMYPMPQPMYPAPQPQPMYPMPQPGYYGPMAYLPVQNNQAYILQPVPQGIQQPTPAPQLPVAEPTPAPVQNPEPVAPRPEPVIQEPVVVPPPPPPPPEVDEDMGGILPEAAPEIGGNEAQQGMAPEAQMEPQGFGFGQEGEFPQGGLPSDQNTGGFEAADSGQPGAARGF